uniref:Peptidase M14 carboxypeptidase A domain-containing protein n=1 Tax=Ditylenchus dipsaci TaxID=166011 RepID=A0A915E6J6_9BILA
MGGIRCCQGVDLNRNFDFHWAKTGSSLNPCSNLYAGQSAFSEPEAKAVASYLTSNDVIDKVDAFITLHTYAQMWIHPYSHETQYYPNDVAKMKKVAEKATGRLRDIYGTKYRVGTGADLLAPASGGSDDWAKEKLGVKYVYLVELRPKLELSNGFILKQEELIPTAVETFEGIKVVIEAVLEENNLSKSLKAQRLLIDHHYLVHLHHPVFLVVLNLFQPYLLPLPQIHPFQVVLPQIT